MAKGGNYRNKVVKQLIDNLTLEGERIIKRALDRRNWQHRTFNLHDSYGSAVFYNGALQPNTIRYAGPKLANPARNNKELGDYRGVRSKAQKGSSYKEFTSVGDNRFLDGDTIYAYGRDEVNKFFNGYKLAIRDGIELVVVAAMYYAGILESGYLGTKYQVISSATTELTKMAKQLGDKVDVYALEISRNRDQAFTNSAFNVSIGQKLVG